MTPTFDNGVVRLYQGDCREVLRELPAGSVQTCVTSPPYWGLRNYGVDGQLGLEPTIDLYVAHMVDVFREVRRVLRGDGTVWLNMGDAFYSNPGNGRGGGSTLEGGAPTLQGVHRVGTHDGLKPKDLCGIPWTVAFALQADGWWLRSDIVWSKPNPMPESVTDRPTRSHEYVFLLSKSARYYYDAEAIREPQTTIPNPKDVNHSTYEPGANQGFHGNGMVTRHRNYNPAGRNKRSVWDIPTEAYPEAHFATFPQKLVEPCILAGTPAKGSCSECGAPWERIVERQDTGQRQKMADGWDTGAGGHGTVHRNGRQAGESGKPVRVEVTTGWRPTCGHDADPEPALVLDPFVGSGTTAFVAQRLGRRCVGIDLSADYLALAEKRLRGQTLPMALG